MNIGFKRKSMLGSGDMPSFPNGDWYVRIRQRGGGAIYSNLHAYAHFGEFTKYGFIDAHEYTEHPGDIAIFARLHLAIENLGTRFTLSAEQVQQILEGDNK